LAATDGTAPIPAVRRAALEPLESTQSRLSRATGNSHQITCRV
jgi:hypothetical protein